MTSTAPLSKVVAIGFNKCATRSFAELFLRSGHAAIHQKLPRGLRVKRKLGRIMRENVEAGRRVFQGIENFVFYGDLIDSNRNYSFDANRLYREIIADYPDTILLLNWRNREDWIKSRLRHGHGEFWRRELEVRGLINQEALLEAWRSEWDQHLQSVRAFMANKPNQLIEYNIDCDKIEHLVQRLPAYNLKAQYFCDIGRSRDRELPPWLSALKSWISFHRPRQQR